MIVPGDVVITRGHYGVYERFDMHRDSNIGTVQPLSVYTVVAVVDGRFGWQALVMGKMFGWTMAGAWVKV